MPGYSLVPGADARAVAEVMDQIEAHARSGGLSQVMLDRVVIVAGELLANAVEHGSEPFSVSWTPAGSSGHLDIGGGCGPGVEAITAAQLPAAVSTRGRGLFLIRELSDHIEETPLGLCVTFRRRRDE